MTERERWIIYPLLFFALGASLRDKFLQHVTTKEVIAGKVICEELIITDPKKPDRIVARLASETPAGDDENSESFGLLVLFDSEGKELCGVTNNMLQVRQITADQIFGKLIGVVDPENPQISLARLTSVTATAPDNSTRRFGSVQLNDDTGAAVFGLVNDQMQMRGISCQGIQITDPANPTRVLAVLGSATIQSEDSDLPTQSVGVLQLNDQRLIGLRGNSTEAPLDSPPPPAPEAAPADAEPASPAPADAAEPSDEDAPSEDAQSDDAQSDVSDEADNK